MRSFVARLLFATLAWLFLSFAALVQAQTSVTNIATITPPATVVNSNNSVSCTVSTGICSAGDTDAVVTQVNLSVAKLVASNTTPVGGTASFSFVIGNTGPSALAAGSFTDTLPALFGTASFVIASGSTGATATSLNVTGSQIAGSLTIPSGGTVTITVQVSAGASGSYTNTLSVLMPAGTSNIGSSTATVSGSVFAADMSASFAGLGTTAAVGSTVAATVSFVNTSVGSAAVSPQASLQLTAGLTAGSVTVTSAQLGVGSYNSATGVVSFANPMPSTLGAGASVTASIEYVQTTAVVAGTATTGAGNDINTANNTATFSVAGSLVATDVGTSLSLTASGFAGATVPGTVTFQNIGVTSAADVTRTVSISGGTVTAVASGGVISGGGQTVSFNVLSMPAGASASFTFTYVLPATGAINATASIATTTPDANAANNTATGLTGVSGVSPDLSVSLTVSPDPLVVGTHTVVVTVSNVGTVPTTGSLTLSLPGGGTTSFVLGAPLSAGQSRVFTASYTLTPLTTGSQTFTVTVSATPGPELNLANNTAVLTVGVGSKLQGIAWIDATRNRIFDGGETPLANLLVRLSNTVSGFQTTTFTASDGRYGFSGLPAGGGYTVEFFTCVSPASIASCTALATTPLNMGAITGATRRTEFGQLSTGTTTLVTTAAGSGVGRSIETITLYAGDNTNNQNLPLDPRGLVYDSITRAPLAGATLGLTGPPGFNPATQLLDVNGAQPNNLFTTGVNGLYEFIFINNPPAGTYTFTVVSAPAGYATSPAVSGNVAQPNEIGGVVTLPYAVPAIATDMQPAYPAPGTPPVGAPRSSAVGAAGTQHAMSLRFAFDNGATYFGELFNNHIPLDSGPGGGSAIDLSILKAGPATLLAGSTGTYTLTISNPGPTAALNATVTDVMPAGLTLLNAAVQPPGALVLNVSAAGLVASTAALPTGLFTVTLIIRAETSAVGTTVTNVATVASTSADATAGNNTASAATGITGVDMGIGKTGPSLLPPGGTASYVLTISNAGPNVATNVTVTDVLPAGLTLLSASVVSGSFTLVTSTTSLTALATTMPVGTAVIALTVNVAATLTGTVTNIASVTNTVADSQPANNSSAATSGGTGADLALTKTGPPSISAAGTASYTLLIVNHGPSVASNVTVTDVLPAGLTLIGVTVAGGSLTTAITPGQLVAVAGVVPLGTITVVLTVQADYTLTGMVTNTAQVASSTPDPVPANNTGSAVSAVREVEGGVLLVQKTGNKTVAEVGDSVQYTLRLRNTSRLAVHQVVLEDLLPAGVRYILGTTRINNVAVPDPAGGIGRQLGFSAGTVAGGSSLELSYFVRLGVGSQQGDGINRATAVFPGARGAPVRSNTALFKVDVRGGVFTSEGCIAGKIYLDCDGNAMQSAEGALREVGIPGVRLVLLDGSFVVSDHEGKYSICGVKPQTHVLKVDRTTLPKGSRLVPSSNRNAGVADSIFVDLKGGELHRADFIEGSCSPAVLDQVKERRARGEAANPEAGRASLRAPLLAPLLVPSTGGTTVMPTPAPMRTQP